MTDPTSSARTPGGHRRPCPALNSTLTSAECGAQRNTRWTCPAGCPFNPLGTEAYDLWLSLELKWQRKAFDFLRVRLSPSQWQKWQREGTLPCGDAAVEQEQAVLYLLQMAMRRQRDAQGRTGWEAWETEGWPGLNNDERSMVPYRRRTFATVLEVQRVVDEQRILCADVLGTSPGSWLVFDRVVAAQTVRFDRFLALLTPFPHFAYLPLLPALVPLELWPDWWSNLTRFHQEERARRPDLTLQDWLLENYAEASLAIEELRKTQPTLPTKPEENQAPAEGTTAPAGLEPLAGPSLPPLSAPVAAPSGQPPASGLEALRRAYRDHYERLLDQPLTFLNGLTPRQAALDPVQRPQLVELMKLHLNKLERRHQQEPLDFSLDGVLAELSLGELRTAP